ncbi:MAG: GNAT family N-acetyltransferase [Anaerolineae bacterium]|nr:GNAT family N-acetyltransferase [Anaerolineae bacterium]
MTIVIKPIALKHTKAFHQALDQVARERRYLLLLESPPLEQIEQVVRYNIERDVFHFVALDGKKMVGWCDIRPYTIPGLTHAGELGMGVVAEYRRQGIGYRLLETTINKALANGLSRIELEVFASNHGAKALYEKLGFEQEGVKRQARYLDGVWDDLIMMAYLKLSKSNDSNQTG